MICDNLSASKYLCKNNFVTTCVKIMANFMPIRLQHVSMTRKITTCRKLTKT